MIKVADVAFAGIVTDVGTVTDGLMPDRLTTSPGAGTACDTVTVPTAVDPPLTEAGLTVSEETAMGNTVRVPEQLEFPKVAVTVRVLVLDAA